jgi:hypothetical protein
MHIQSCERERKHLELNVPVDLRSLHLSPKSLSYTEPLTTMSPPIIQNNYDHANIDPPILLLPKSVTSIRLGSLPKKIKITANVLQPGETGDATLPRSLITVRAAPHSHSLPRELSITRTSNATINAMATAKGLSPLRPHLSSFQRILNRLSPRSPPFDSQATARPHSPLLVGIEGLKVDELEHEKCFRCEKEMERDEVELKRVPKDGLQWVCKGGCESGTAASGAGEKKHGGSGEVSPIGKKE